MKGGGLGVTRGGTESIHYVRGRNPSPVDRIFGLPDLRQPPAARTGVHRRLPRDVPWRRGGDQGRVHRALGAQAGVQAAPACRDQGRDPREDAGRPGERGRRAPRAHPPDVGLDGGSGVTGPGRDRGVRPCQGERAQRMVPGPQVQPHRQENDGYGDEDPSVERRTEFELYTAARRPPSSSHATTRSSSATTPPAPGQVLVVVLNVIAAARQDPGALASFVTFAAEAAPAGRGPLPAGGGEDDG